ncbi:hypothetical protein DPMN_072362 [Dreissena polymorpha]|uniref:Uncharacterized protein n=1 Tax=Dreissena polymorpha TaxID=45954 RepID=A0A9D4BWE5_DREPO|nr:hypothetical protein DPMN_072362 [Dreissena polymorpha]
MQSVTERQTDGRSDHFMPSFGGIKITTDALVKGCGRIQLLTKYDIIRTNLLIKFHGDRKINVTSRVLTRKNAAPPGSNVFQPIGIIFQLVQDIIGINPLTKFHEDRTVNVASRVKNAPPLGSHFFQANIIIFKLIQDIIEANLLTKFHEDWK